MWIQKYFSFSTLFNFLWKAISIYFLIFRDFLGLKSIVDQNFGTICHTEVCLTFSKLAAKLSKLSKTFRGQAQPRTLFDLNGLKNGLSKHFDSCLKSMHLFQRLMGAMNCRKRSQKKTIRPQQWGVNWGLNTFYHHA